MFFIILVVCAPIAVILSTVYIYLFDNSAIVLDQESSAFVVPSTESFTQEMINSPVVHDKTTSTNPPPASTCRKRFVGIFTEWETPEISENQLQKLTHVIFLYASIDSLGNVAFKDNHAKERFLDMKKKARAGNPDLKVMVAVGGWSIASRFSNAKKQKNLINSIVQFVNKYDIDGVDIFWTYSWKEDKVNYPKFIQELKKKLNDLKNKKERDHQYILSIVVPPLIQRLEDGYNMNEIINEVDFINVHSFDYFNQDGLNNKNFIGPISPLYGGQSKNVDDTMRYLVCKTREPSKVNMAVVFYGTYWKNVSSLFLDSRTDNIWKDAELNNQRYQVNWRNLEKEGWNKSDISWHERSKSSYIWNQKTRTFLGLETERSLREKKIYANHKNIGGILIRAIDQDDEKNTLLNVITSGNVCSKDKKNDVKYECDN